jgi:hypothetical protein
MMRLLEDFHEGRVPFHVLVYRLDSAMEIADFHEPGVRRGFQEVWEPLYEVDKSLNCESQCVDFLEVMPLIRNFAEFLMMAQQKMDFPQAG